ncbi:hypothetical protein HPB52_022925 [Rhipicephalus sanguineus]|uniref:Tick transposon n=1 Tax=Rhipicephalus sanguineus TaxID=34632 RepID=A0A9D4QDG3_RHISA|nr:hypothetical protein HPB52_022925 [Rhipicephalus sanguineus]
MVRNAASRATQPEADRIVLGGVDALPTKMSKIEQPAISGTVKVLQEKKQNLLQSDREGGFVILTSSIYQDKATSATNETFAAARGFVPSKAKKKAVELCEQAGLPKFTASVKASKGTCLTAFCTVKTHKDSQPFRVIITERKTWQRCLGSYFQKAFSLLKVDDPYLVKRPLHSTATSGNPVRIEASASIPHRSHNTVTASHVSAHQDTPIKLETALVAADNAPERNRDVTPGRVAEELKLA